VLVSVLGCQSSRFSIDDLPHDPVALVVRTKEETERLLKDEEKKEAEKRPVPLEREGIVPLETLQEMIGVETGEDSAKALLGRLVLLDPPEKETTRAEFAMRGARPLDWSPDHQRLLFAALRDRTTHIFEWNRASGDLRQITTGWDHHVGACYGPDGQIAVVRSTPLVSQGARAGGGLRIFVIDANGRERAVTAGPVDTSPTWSPDGRRLVFQARDPRGDELIQAIDPAQPDAVQTLARGRTPVFSNDGQWLVYSAKTRAGWKLWRMHADGSGKRILGKGPFQEHTPAISPDGKYVIYVGAPRKSDIDTQLMVRRMDGASERALDIDGDGSQPVW
jgi:sugar lactone lactonase YvrE